MKTTNRIFSFVILVASLRLLIPRGYMPSFPRASSSVISLRVCPHANAVNHSSAKRHESKSEAPEGKDSSTSFCQQQGFSWSIRVSPFNTYVLPSRTETIVRIQDYPLRLIYSLSVEYEFPIPRSPPIVHTS